MTKMLVLYYSSYGHVEQMAHAQAEGARRVSGAEVVVKRVPELVERGSSRAALMFKVDQPAPIADPNELDQYDGIIFGTPTRFGNMAAQMRNFLDQTGALWFRHALVGKVGSVLLLHGQPARRPGNHHHLVPHHAAALRHGHHRAALHLQGPFHHARGDRRHAIWRELDHRRGRRRCACRARSSSTCASTRAST